MFLDILENMDKENKNSLLHLFLLFVKVFDKKKWRYFALDFSAKLGEGAYGKVYKSYEINRDDGKFIKSIDGQDKCYAAKLFKEKVDKIDKEREFLSALYETLPLIECDKGILLLSEYVPGINLLDKKSKLSQEIARLPFISRLSIIHQLLYILNPIHHASPFHDKPFVHGDISGQNIKVHIDKESGKIEVFLLDFGLSDYFENEEDTKPTKIEGTPEHLPPEVIFNRRRSLKSDIYALTPLFLQLLGAKKTFDNKRNYQITNRFFYSTPFEFKGLFKELDLRSYPHNLLEPCKVFLNKMQSLAYEKRPNSDECLSFFTALYAYISQKEEGIDDNLSSYYAKLCLLSQGLWSDTSHISSQFNFDTFPFEQHLDFCEAIINRYHLHQLSAPALWRLFRNHPLTLKEFTMDDENLSVTL